MNPEPSVSDIMASRETNTTPPSTFPAPVDKVEEERSEIYYPGAAVGLFMWAFVALLLSAWAGIVPYVGPIFGFSADGSPSWTWNDAHTYGALVPGAVGFVSCLVILACARRPTGMQSAGTLASSGFVVVLCGAWLTIFPVAWAVIRAPYFQLASPTLTLEYWLGYASGPGVLLVAFGAFVMGRARIERVAHRLVNRVSVA
ncbi:MAG TPA: hypothetical protein VMF33_03395 [Acidimicrobiales bacterium]|nr:hypothetical protein [Acidimicrobiales bacterium]